MDKILFEQLTQSIHQMNEIMEGTRHPSRTFHIDAMKIKKKSVRLRDCRSLNSRI